MSLSPDTQHMTTDDLPVSSTSDCAELSTSQGCDAKYNRDDSEGGGKQPWSPEGLLAVIAQQATIEFGETVTVENLRSSRRFLKFSIPRFLFCYLLRQRKRRVEIKRQKIKDPHFEMRPYSFQNIASYLSPTFNHTSVMHAIEAAEEFASNPHRTDKKTRAFNAMLQGVKSEGWS